MKSCTTSVSRILLLIEAIITLSYVEFSRNFSGNVEFPFSVCLTFFLKTSKIYVEGRTIARKICFVSRLNVEINLCK